MELSSKTRYALLALLELASHYLEGEPLQIKEIAAQQNIPERYLEQLLATLRRGGIVLSQRGAKGGYLLAQEPIKITLLEVIDCLEGAATRTKPETANSTLENRLIEEVWQVASDSAREVLQSYTLQDLCEKRNACKQVDIMYYI